MTDSSSFNFDLLAVVASERVREELWKFTPRVSPVKQFIHGFENLTIYLANQTLTWPTVEDKEHSDPKDFEQKSMTAKRIDEILKNYTPCH